MLGGIVLFVFLMFFAVVAVFVFWAIGIYNRLVSLRNNNDRAFANIDVLLKQRHDELPKLVETCKGYMKHEQGTFEKITQARTMGMNAGTVAEKAQADNMLTGALRSLFAVAENYPELKANTNFMQLQGRISEIESGLTTRRDDYNDNTNRYNIQIEIFPDTIIARFLGFGRRELFKATEEDRQDVKISFA